MATGSEGNSLVRVRYAPSPTGTLHIGGARTALFNFLFARHHGGRFILRVEDTDQARLVPGSEAAMMEGLRALGIEWDEGPDIGGQLGPYRQSERMSRYREAAATVLAAGAAYRCFCTPEELALERERLRSEGKPPRYSGRCRAIAPAQAAERAVNEPYVLRLKIPATGSIAVNDLIRGTVVFDYGVLDDFVIVKSDGSPVYNFAVVLDDHDMGITHVIRGEEHLSNTPKQILVARALGFEPPAWAHVPMILAPDRSKLSKRHGAVAVGEYLDQGILPEALTNYLMLLGWSHPAGKEILSLADVIPAFDLDRIQHTAAIYDQKKLEWLSGQYLRILPVERIAEAVLPFLARAGVNAENGPSLVDAVALSRERARTLRELADTIRFCYERPESYEAKGVAKHLAESDTGPRLARLAEVLGALSEWDHEHLQEAFDRRAEAEGVKRALLIHPTRLALTGRTVGPGLFELMEVLGRDEAVWRLRALVDRIARGQVAEWRPENSEPPGDR